MIDVENLRMAAALGRGRRELLKHSAGRPNSLEEEEFLRSCGEITRQERGKESTSSVCVTARWS